jgi:hypothetical protein
VKSHWSLCHAGGSVSAMNGAVATDDESRRRALRWRARLRLLAGVGIPVATYVVLRLTLRSETAALAITETLPVAWVLAVGIRKGRVDPIAVIAAIVLGVALIVSVAMGGSALPLKLRRSLVTGSIGVACLASVVIRRPLLPFVLDLVRRSLPQSRRLGQIVSGDRTLRRKWLVLTAIIGVTLLCDAAAQLTLALTVWPLTADRGTRARASRAGRPRPGRRLGPRASRAGCRGPRAK